jgi:hypothetical protein
MSAIVLLKISVAALTWRALPGLCTFQPPPSFGDHSGETIKKSESNGFDRSRNRFLTGFLLWEDQNN